MISSGRKIDLVTPSSVGFGVYLGTEKSGHPSLGESKRKHKKARMEVKNRD